MQRRSRSSARTGFTAREIEAIARRARVPRGLIAYCFSIKEGLFQALARNRADAIERTRHRVGSGPDDPFAWTLSLFAPGGATTDWVHLMIWEALEWDPNTELALASDRRAFWQSRVAAMRRTELRNVITHSLPATAQVPCSDVCGEDVLAAAERCR